MNGMSVSAGFMVRRISAAETVVKPEAIIVPVCRRTATLKLEGDLIYAPVYLVPDPQLAAYLDAYCGSN